MKKIITLLLFCAVSLSASADIFVWNYKTAENGIYYAVICSSPEYLDGDFSKDGTGLCVQVAVLDGKEVVDIQLFGDYVTHDLDERHKEVVVDIGGKKQRWRVEFIPVGNLKYTRLRFVNSSRMIDYLVEADSFSITLPVFGQGATTFYFYCNSYPLNWD